MRAAGYCKQTVIPFGLAFTFLPDLENADDAAGQHQSREGRRVVNDITSSGSPSSAVVEGTKPQSCGYVKPTKRDFVSVKASSFGSKANFARLPRGVSTTTFTAPSSAKGGRLKKFGMVFLVFDERAVQKEVRRIDAPE